MDDWLLELLAGVGYIFDTPGALTRGVLAGKPGERVGGREMLEEWGVLGENTEGLDAGDVAGFGADLLFDPLNLFGGLGLASKASKGAKVAKANKASKAMRAKGFMPEEVAALTKVVDETGAPLRTYHGTAKSFDEFNPAFLDEGSLYGPGIYTTDTAEIAGSYTDKNALATLGMSRDDIGRQLDEIAGEAQLGGALFAGQLSKQLKSATQHMSDKRLVEYLENLPSQLGMGHTPLGGGKLAATTHAEQLTFDALIRPAENIRMQFLDFRNPLDIEKGKYLPEDIPLVAGNRMPSREMEHIEKSLAAQRRYAEVGGAIAERNKGGVARLLAERDALREVEAAAGVSGKTVFGSAKREALGRRLRDVSSGVTSTDILKEMGFDSILYPGGAATKQKLRHQAYVAFDPSQIFAPYIAPALQETPRMSPLVAALTGYNVMQGMPQ